MSSLPAVALPALPLARQLKQERPSLSIFVAPVAFKDWLPDGRLLVASSTPHARRLVALPADGGSHRDLELPVKIGAAAHERGKAANRSVYSSDTADASIRQSEDLPGSPRVAPTGGPL